MENNTKILIIRHAEPDYEKDSLTDKGFKEAKLLAERLSEETPCAIYCSPLGRARRTAEEYLDISDEKMKIFNWLKEFYIPVRRENGSIGIPWDLYPDFVNKNPELLDINRWSNTKLMKSGRVGVKYEKVTASFDKLLKAHGYERYGLYYKVNKPNTDTIMLFCHFGVECVLLSHLMNVAPTVLWQGLCAAPSSVTTVYTEERKKGYAHFRCASFGDVSHLYKFGEEPSFAARFCEIYDDMTQRH